MGLLMVCPQCGTEFEPNPSRRQKYCKIACTHLAGVLRWQKKHPDLTYAISKRYRRTEKGKQKHIAGLMRWYHTVGGQLYWKRHRVSRQARSWFFEAALKGCCCGEKRLMELTLDHVVPLALGGADDLTNWQILCKKCHNEKTSKDIHDIHMAKKMQKEHELCLS